MPNIETILRDHITLKLECIDRLYLVTPAGRRIALFFSKTYARVLRPGLARLDATPPIDAPDPLRAAWRSLDQALSKLVHDARLAA